MRVLWITGSFFPTVGGLQIYIEKTIEKLADMCDVGLVMRSGQWYPGDKPIAQFIVPQPDNRNHSTRWQNTVSALEQIVDEFSPDVVHFGNARSAVCRSVIPERIPAVATVHGNDLTDVDSSRPGDEDLTSSMIESLNNCNCVTAVSSHTATLLREWGVEIPVEIFAPGCDLEFFRPWPEVGARARRAWSIPETVPLVLTVSRLVTRKGHLNVLAAIERLPFAVHWVIVGEGPYLGQLADAVAAAGLSERVSMVGAVADDDLLGLYNAADVFVFMPEELRVPGRVDSEGFGLVLHEAAACGKPVITSALAGCRDAVIDGGTGILVPPASPERLADALSLLLADEKMAKALGAGGLALVRNSGGWARLARQYLNTYEEISAYAG